MKVDNINIVEQGSIIWIDSEPHAGYEFGGHDPEHGNIRRPMVVLSNTDYNKSTDYVIGMLVTHHLFQDRRLYLPILIPDSNTRGSIIMWQIYCYDYCTRHGQVTGKVSDKDLHFLLKNMNNLF
ncbi:transcriptional regulator (plasmid) [Lactiplantibacillus plantarum subsp. plantarum]|nr:transcriptional regulator [Lactiplantibacillus plantarum subsp. plantarum]